MELNEENLKKIGLDMDVDYRKALGCTDTYKKLGINYAIIYNYDSVKVAGINDIELDLENMIEGRFFNESMEVVVRIDEDEIKGNIFIDNGETEMVSCEEYILRSGNYKRLKVKKYFALDEDKQAYAFYLKPCSLVKEV